MSVTESSALRYQALDPDVLLMLQVRDDNAAAFEELVLRYQNRLITVLEHFVHKRPTPPLCSPPRTAARPNRRDDPLRISVGRVPLARPVLPPNFWQDHPHENGIPSNPHSTTGLCQKIVSTLAEGQWHTRGRLATRRGGGDIYAPNAIAFPSQSVIVRFSRRSKIC